MVLAITYLSSATMPFTPEALTELLTSSRARNGERGVTGVLLHVDGGFIQTLEGPDHVVEETFQRIGGDPRHRGLLEVWRESIDERTFPDWSMGFREVSAAVAGDIPGFHPFLSGSGEQLVEDDQLFTPAAFYRVFRDGSRLSQRRLR